MQERNGKNNHYKHHNWNDYFIWIGNHGRTENVKKHLISFMRLSEVGVSKMVGKVVHIFPVMLKAF